MFKIGDFSNLTRVSVRMLRYYDEVGLFTPIHVDDFTAYRYYSATQIKRLNFIVSLRDLGFSVADIAKIVDEKDASKQLDMLVNKQNETIKDIEKQRIRLEKIKSTILNIDKEKIKMSYKVEIKSIPSYKAITYREVIPAYDQEGILWEKLGTYVGMNQISCTQVAFAIYYDDECKESNVDAEVIMGVDTLGKDDGKFTYRKTAPIEKCACVLVPGEYKNIGPAFNFIAEWIEQNGYAICGNARQACLKGPWNEESVDNYLTQIMFPIR
jgi:DNA-binding transcriptional MerR regulator